MISEEDRRRIEDKASEFVLKDYRHEKYLCDTVSKMEFSSFVHGAIYEKSFHEEKLLSEIKHWEEKAQLGIDLQESIDRESLLKEEVERLKRELEEAKALLGNNFEKRNPDPFNKIQELEQRNSELQECINSVYKILVELKAIRQ